MAFLGDPPGRVRPAGQGRLDEGRAALGGRHRREPVAGAPDQVLVPGVRLVQDAQGHLRGGGLAAGRPAVRLERVAEPAVVVAVGGHRVPYRRGRPVLEQPLEPAPVEHPGVGGDEGGGRVEVWSVHRPMRTRGAPGVLNETAVVMPSWQVDARALPPGYTEWPAPAALRDAVACLWAQVTTADADRAGLVLPDGCTDLIWEQGRGAFVAGPDTGPVPTTMPRARSCSASASGPRRAAPRSGFRSANCATSASTWPTCGPATRGGCPPRSTCDTAAARVLDVTAALVADGAPDPAVTRAARLLRDPQARAEDVAADVGLSLRQLRRRCHAAVGYGPKTLQRVLRFRRFVSRIDASPDARTFSTWPPSRPRRATPTRPT